MCPYSRNLEERRGWKSSSKLPRSFYCDEMMMKMTMMSGFPFSLLQSYCHTYVRTFSFFFLKFFLELSPSMISYRLLIYISNTAPNFDFFGQFNLIRFSTLSSITYACLPVCLPSVFLFLSKMEQKNAKLGLFSLVILSNRWCARETENRNWQIMLWKKNIFILFLGATGNHIRSFPHSQKVQYYIYIHIDHH